MEGTAVRKETGVTMQVDATPREENFREEAEQGESDQIKLEGVPSRTKTAGSSSRGERAGKG